MSSGGEELRTAVVALPIGPADLDHAAAEHHLPRHARAVSSGPGRP